MISRDTIQQIVSRIDIVDIVGEFVRLRRRGANYIGLCPFHDEKTPSFSVSPTKEIYKCFGCGKSGNAITFLMEHEKYSYVEALRWLAQKYQIEVEETEVTPEQRQQQQAAESLYAINNFAQKHFADNLESQEEGIHVGQSYLRQRGLRKNVIEEFGIGYCTADNAFTKAAIDGQFNKDLLLKSGLTTLRNGTYQDNYRKRIIFPIHNQTGKVVGFGARLIEKNDKAPKYINTPENEIYVKSRILYGLWQARQAIGKNDECILVEGYMDVVALHQAGIKNVVASSGTSLTPDQVRLVGKLTQNLTIFYDGDAAGIAAAMRGMNIALEEGLTVRIVSLPEAEDPDSYVRNFGAAALEKFITDNKKDFIFFQLDLALKSAGNDSSKKSDAVRQIAESISKLSRPEDFILRQDYIRQVSAILKIEEAGLINLINSITRENLRKSQNRFTASNTSSEASSDKNPLTGGQQDDDNDIDLLLNNNKLKFEKSIIRCLLEYGLRSWEGEDTVADYLLKEWSVTEFLTDPDLLQIAEDYTRIYESGEKPELKDFLYQGDQQLNKLVASLLASPYEISSNWKDKFKQHVPDKDDLYIADVTETMRFIYLKNIRKMLLENGRELQREDSFDKIQHLIRTHQKLKSIEQDLASQIGMIIKK